MTEPEFDAIRAMIWNHWPWHAAEVPARDAYSEQLWKGVGDEPFDVARRVVERFCATNTVRPPCELVVVSVTNSKRPAPVVHHTPLTDAEKADRKEFWGGAVDRARNRSAQREQEQPHAAP